jgi:cell division protein ZapD
MGLLRDSGAPQRMVAAGGQYQQSLPQGKTYHLLRVRLDGATAWCPRSAATG